MEGSAALPLARLSMTEFADQTGLSSSGTPPRRYLWTDAFAVCTFLELYRQTGLEEFRQLAERLVAQVHQVLGRHRSDDPRTGRLSGLGEAEGEGHPTIGGLRIGKPLPERPAADPFDENQEWDRDGQYYHYLTKWQHALHRFSRASGDPTALTWAMELAKTAHARFGYTAPGGRRRLYWKMSIDLSRPLIPSMGQHDPLDGLVTCSQLRAAVRDLGRNPGPELDAMIVDLADLCRNVNWATDDPLGTGGLLFDACRIMQLKKVGAFDQGDLLEALLDAAQVGLEAFATRNPFRLPAEYRLPFRELGLAIGLHAWEKMRVLVEENPQLFEQSSLHRRLEALQRYAPFSEKIESFWIEERGQAQTWSAHREINLVMLATSLVPEEFLSVLN